MDTLKILCSLEMLLTYYLIVLDFQLNLRTSVSRDGLIQKVHDGNICLKQNILRTNLIIRKIKLDNNTKMFCRVLNITEY